MNIKAFLSAPCGRLFATAGAVALAGAGVLAFLGTNPPGIVIPAICLICVVLLILSIGLATSRFPPVALVLLLSMPIVGGLYFAGLTVIGGAGVLGGVVLIGLSLLPAALAATGGSRAAASAS